MRDLHLEIDNFLRERNISFKRDTAIPFITHLLFQNNSSFYLFDDRWVCKRPLVEGVIASRSGNCKTIFARKCKILTPQRDNLYLFKDFLDEYHFYGNAKAKYYLGLEQENKIVAVASFSQPRPLPRQKSCLTSDRVKSIPKEFNPLYRDNTHLPDRNIKEAENKIIIVDSYEWVRYASMPGVRVVGGMGRLLKEFERTICVGVANINQRPYEIMSYADLEFSGGATYTQLGFLECGFRKPVEFAVMAGSYQRIPISRAKQKKEDAPLYTLFNLGSLKYIKPYSL